MQRPLLAIAAIAAILLTALVIGFGGEDRISDSSGEPEPADIDSVSDLIYGIENAAADSAFRLTPAFAADLALNGPVYAVINHDHNIIIDGGSAGPMAASSALHMQLIHNGAGTVSLRGLELRGPAGGVDLGSVGKFAVEGCSFTGFGTTALNGGKEVRIADCYFGGNSSRAAYVAVASAKVAFERCTFEGNTARAMTLAGGTPADEAVFSIRECYFKDNSAANQGGGAIYLQAGHFSLTVEDSIFVNNRATGTSTVHGGNNRVDGGAIYVSADFGMDGELNILRSNFKDNFAQDDGGAILVLGRQITTAIRSNIVNCTFDGNTVAGAQYGGTRTILGIPITVWVTDGTGGAISYFGMTESEITHCTFIGNGVTGALAAGSVGSNLGSVGGGGAVGVDTGEVLTSVHDLPKCPTLTNNIFVANYINNPASQAVIAQLNALTGNSLGNIKERSQTGNIYLKPLCDADYQTGPNLDDPRGPLDNNGNIGWDAGRYLTDGTPKDPSGTPDNPSAPQFAWGNNGLNTQMGVLVKNIFKNWSDNGTPTDPTDDTAAPESFGGGIGSPGHQAVRWAYIPSPISDELYRDGSGPYYVESVNTDARGYARDVFPNAGAVEIYWTKFNPGFDGGDLGAGTGQPDSDGGNDESADWAAAVPSEIVDPDDPSKVYAVIKSLNFGDNGSYYVMTTTGLPGSPSGYIVSLPRSAFLHSNEAEYGLAGLRGSLPLNPSDPTPSWKYPLHQPGDRILSVKQTLTAEWEKDMFRVDFDLNYDGGSNWYSSGEAGKEAPRLHVPKGAFIAPPIDPLRPDYTFVGWYSDKDLRHRWSFTTDAVNADTVLYAKWRAVSTADLKITATADAGSTITPDGTVGVAPGGSAVFRFSALEGYAIVAVLVDGAPIPSPESGRYVFSNVQKNHTIEVLSEPAGASGGGGGEGGGGGGETHDGENGSDDGKMAILNMILAVLTVALGLIILIVGRNRLEKGSSEDKSRTAYLIRLVSLALGIVAVILFFATEDLTKTVQAADVWTAPTFVLFAASAVLAFFSLKFDEDPDAGPPKTG
jgi:uncharacterized repeat protein (TIGR02543 family)